MESRKVFNYESIILKNLTIEKEGYDPDTVGRTSNRFIWAICRYCGKPHRIRKSHFTKQNSACHKECKLEVQKKCSPFSNPEVREKAKRTNLEKYGAEYASQNKNISKKISETKMTQESQNRTKQTNLEKYGVENVSQNEEIKEKMRKTNLERFGTEYAMQNDGIKAKVKKMMLEKFGTEYASQNKEIAQKISDSKNTPESQNKLKQTNLERFGVEYSYQSEKVKAKIRKTNLEKYGVEYIIQNEEQKEKRAQNNIEKYGIPNTLELPETKEKQKQAYIKIIEKNEDGKFNMINALKNDEFWKLMKDEKYSINQLCEKFNINPDSLRSALVHDFRDKYHQCYSYPKCQTQNEIKSILSQLGNFNILFNNRSIIAPFELDIYLPDKNFAIEYNGDFWHSEAWMEPSEARNKHFNKLKICREKGIRLFNLFEHVWNNRKGQVLNFIKSILDCNNENIFARKCLINNNECRYFLNNNHIQGYGNGTIKFFNLIYNNEIVGTMTASKHHRQGNEGVIVLNRLCYKDGINVIGGSEKLFNQFKEWSKNEGYEKIVSWSDNCWTEGKIYGKLGFNLEKEYGSDYFYWDCKKRCYVSKQSQMKKQTNCPEGMTEREWCLERDLYRVWDCGKKKWTYKIN